MPKVVSPLFSLSASGSFAKILNFTSVHGSAVARKKRIAKRPFDPRTPIQLFERAYLRDLNFVFADLNPVEFSFFRLSARSMSMSGYNLFIKTYQKQHPSVCGLSRCGDNRLGGVIL